MDESKSFGVTQRDLKELCFHSYTHPVFCPEHIHHRFHLHLKQLNERRITMSKYEVQYYPPGCTNVCKIVVEATDGHAAIQIVMAMFNIPQSRIYAVNFAY